MGIQKITVIGATGMLGVPVARALVDAGFQVTALVRQPVVAAKKLPAQVRLMQGDLQDGASIARALEGADGLYINLSTRYEDLRSSFKPEREGLAALIAAAKQARIARIGFISSFLVRDYQGSWTVMRDKQQALSVIKNAGLAYTIFYPSCFMENIDHAMRFGPMVGIATTKGPKNWWIAGADYGRQVAAAFAVPAAENQEFPVQGLQAFDQKEAAQIFATNHGRKKLLALHFPRTLELMSACARLNWRIAYNYQLLNVVLNTPETFEADRTWDLLGSPKISLAEFAKNMR